MIKKFALVITPVTDGCFDDCSCISRLTIESRYSRSEQRVEKLSSPVAPPVVEEFSADCELFGGGGSCIEKPSLVTNSIQLGWLLQSRAVVKMWFCLQTI